MKMHSHIASIESFKGMASVGYEEFDSGSHVVSWTDKSIRMKHYELLATTWVCKNVQCQHVNALRDSECAKCHRVAKTLRAVNISK